MTEFGGGSVAGDAPDGAPSAPIVDGACAVTALCFSADEHTLTWGDDSGRIVIWDLTSLLKLMPIPDIDKRTCNHSKGANGDATDSGCATNDFSTSTSTSGGIVVGAFGMAARPSARLRGGTRSARGSGVKRGTDNLRESAWLLAKLQGTTVSIRHIWQAHTDAITSVVRIAQPPAIFSTSADQLATVWKYDGSECYGSLRRGGPLKGDALACFHQARAKALSSKNNSAGVPTSFVMGASCPQTASRAAVSAPCAALVPEPAESGIRGLEGMPVVLLADGDARGDCGGSGGSAQNERRPPAAPAPGIVRAKGRRAQSGTEWCLPADTAIPHQVITSKRSSRARRHRRTT